MDGCPAPAGIRLGLSSVARTLHSSCAASLRDLHLQEVSDVGHELLELLLHVHLLRSESSLFAAQVGVPALRLGPLCAVDGLPLPDSDTPTRTSYIRHYMLAWSSPTAGWSIGPLG